jgi:DNA-binding CsgD family transcriptional regulator
MGERRTRLNDPVSRLATRDDIKLPAAVADFSERERVVLNEYIAKGDSASAVAKLIGVSPHKVRSLARGALSKLRHPSRNIPLTVDGGFKTKGGRLGV